MIVAIDGPAGSGKSSVAKGVAALLGFHYLDTGAMYRAVAEQALRQHVPLDDEHRIARIAEDHPIEFVHAGREALASRVLIGGRDVTHAIRTPAVDDAVSPVARLPLVRKAMVAQQRSLARTSDTVVEGRDIGTVVFPDAEVKIFLTATPEERARRRTAQNLERGIPVEHIGVLDALARRDAADSSRSHSPLIPASDAIELDTTDLAIDEVVAKIASLARGCAP